ncbi:MAG: TetR/AcrR family transcriptional regulator [Terrimesophilobacter sp.]
MTKKENTKAKLQAAGRRLIQEQGYEATTADQIAAECGVSTMTFFRHFPSKAMVVLDDPYDPMIASAIAAQPRSLPAIERVRRGLLAAWIALPEPDNHDQRSRVRIIAHTPELRAKAWENNTATRAAIVNVLVRDDVDRLSAEVAAGACLGALEAALLDWGTSSEGTLGERIATALGLLGSTAEESND